MSTRASTGRDSNVQKYYNLISKNQIKRISALGRKKNRDAEGLFVAETPKVIREFLKQGWKPTALYTTQPEFWSSEEREDVSERDLQKISFLKNAHEALAVFPIPEHTIISYEGLTLVLDAVRDPGNLGTIIRLCDWFGVKNILASPDTADCYNPKVVQASMGSLARVSVQYQNLDEILQQTEQPVYGAMMDGDSVYRTDLSEHAFLVMGNEGVGISSPIEKLLTERISIPQFGEANTESLNVATATAILLSEFRRTTET